MPIYRGESSRYGSEALQSESLVPGRSASVPSAWLCCGVGSSLLVLGSLLSSVCWAGQAGVESVDVVLRLCVTVEARARAKTLPLE